MDYSKVLDALDEYIIDFKNSTNFIEYQELKLEINKVLKKEILAFKNAESLYLEAKTYGKYHPSLNDYQKKFVIAKEDLYSKELVIKFLKLESLLQEELDSFTNNIKESISNKYKITKKII